MAKRAAGRKAAKGSNNSATVKATAARSDEKRRRWSESYSRGPLESGRLLANAIREQRAAITQAMAKNLDRLILGDRGMARVEVSCKIRTYEGYTYSKRTVEVLSDREGFVRFRLLQSEGGPASSVIEAEFVVAAADVKTAVENAERTGGL